MTEPACVLVLLLFLEYFLLSSMTIDIWQLKFLSSRSVLRAPRPTLASDSRSQQLTQHSRRLARHEAKSRRDFLMGRKEDSGGRLAERTAYMYVVLALGL